MNIPRYTLPAVVAAGLHGALFVSSLLTSTGVAYVKLEKPRPPLVVPLEEPFVQPPEEAATDDPVDPPTSVRRGEPLPESPEPPPSDHRSDFAPPVVDLTAVKLEPRTDLTVIGPRGRPDGVGEWAGGIAVPEFISIDKLDRPPHARVQRAPDYPPGLKQSGIGGSVVVEFAVDTTGRVVSATALRYTHGEFVEPALRAVRSWRFEPGRKNGRMVAFRMMIPIEFGITN